jgi:hypothetical protein
MTREEAIDIIKSECYVFNPLNFDRSTMVNTALDMAVKALEQEPVLDKISTEIEQVKSIMNEEIINHNRKDLINFINGLNQSLLIIDKYKGESEDKE